MIIRSKTQEANEIGEHCIIWSLVICSLYQIRTIGRQKPRRAKTAGHVARLGKTRNAHESLNAKQLKKHDMAKWIGLIWHKIDISGRYGEIFLRY